MINRIDSISQEPDGLNKFVVFRNDFIFIKIPLNSIKNGYWKRTRIKTNVRQSYSVCKSRAIFHIATNNWVNVHAFTAWQMECQRFRNAEIPII